MHCVDSAENAPFKSSGVIYWSLPRSSLPDELSIDKSSLPDELSIDKSDSDGSFSPRMARDRSNKTTGSSLIIAHWQISFLANASC